jgi:putative Holliday junction resolvase
MMNDELLGDDILSARVLAIDPGKKRIGLAMSDPFGNFAVGLDTIPGTDLGDPLPLLKSLCERHEIAHLVIGLPLHMNGDEGDGAQQARELARQLEEELRLPVTLLDERLTSRIAEQALRDQGIQGSRRRKSGIIDQTAAMLLLQDFLGRRANLRKQ